MQTTKYIWQNGTFLPWAEAQVHVLNRSLHYGIAAFEGIRFYETKMGSAIFRLQDHMKRLAYSASAINMKLPFSEEELCAATCELVKRNEIPAGYIRPIAYFTGDDMGLNPESDPGSVALVCWPWGKYLGDESVSATISKFRRIPPSVSDMNAKITGHYINSIMATREAKSRGFHEAILLDEKDYIAEGPGENIFMVRGSAVVTPKTGTILPGLTRATIMQLARDLGHEVSEENISVDDFKKADEAFFVGTACEVKGISKLDEKEFQPALGAVTTKLREAYAGLVRGGNTKYSGWLTHVN